MPMNSIIQKNSRRRQVCLFGTSANPPTGIGGHLGIVTSLCSMDRFDEVRILPVYRHPFSSKRDDLVSFDHRMKMCELAFSSLPKAQVSNAEKLCFEQRAKGLSGEELQFLKLGTAELLETLMEEEPDVDFSFCLGADTFMDLTAWKWRRSRDVLKLLDGRLVVLYRKGMGYSDDALPERVATINQSHANGNIILVQIPILRAVSSSMVRPATEDDELKNLVAPAVLDYIKRNKLYAFHKDETIKNGMTSTNV